LATTDRVDFLNSVVGERTFLRSLLPVEAWEAKKRKKLEDGLYRGTLRRGGHHAGCGCAVGEQGEEVHIQPLIGT